MKIEGGRRALGDKWFKAKRADDVEYLKGEKGELSKNLCQGIRIKKVNHGGEELISLILRRDERGEWRV